jgi:hypothetical protein
MQTHTLTTTNEFANTLVTLITGISLQFYTETEQVTILQQCYDLFQNYMVSYFQENFTEVDTMRLQASVIDENVFSKFSDLNSKFNQALSSFSSDLISTTK